MPCLCITRQSTPSSAVDNHNRKWNAFFGQRCRTTVIKSQRPSARKARHLVHTLKVIVMKFIALSRLGCLQYCCVCTCLWPDCNLILSFLHPLLPLFAYSTLLLRCKGSVHHKNGHFLKACEIILRTPEPGSSGQPIGYLSWS